MPDRVLLLVAVNTDQPHIKRRMELILAAAHPIEAVANAEVVALNLASLTKLQRHQLVTLFGEDAVAQLGAERHA